MNSCDQLTGKEDEGEVVTFALEGAGEFRLLIPKPGQRKSFFIFGLYKGGSTLLNRIFTSINRVLDIPEVGIFQQATEQGIPSHRYDSNEELRQVIHSRGYCYNAFRYFCPFLAPVFSEPRKSILLVRDPRDILTSAYFSEAYSHVVMPGEIADWQLKQRAAVKELSIDEFVIRRAPDILERLESYKPVLANPGTRLYRYEDVIFSKQEWIVNMLNHLGLEAGSVEIAEIAKSVDQRPLKEDPSAHIRKVTPGDHREKLKPETIANLGEIFQEMLTRFGYTSGAGSR